MTEALLLDTNALISLFDGTRRIAERMAVADRVLIPSVVYGELAAGTAGATKRERATRAAIERLLDMPGVDVLPVTRRTGDYYARVYNFLRGRGTPIPTNDIWIAAGVLETGGLLCTCDKHLLDLPLIRVTDY